MCVYIYIYIYIYMVHSGIPYERAYTLSSYALTLCSSDALEPIAPLSLLCGALPTAFINLT